jgi:hyperosmotically inducible periplasmic protein
MQKGKVMRLNSLGVGLTVLGLSCSLLTPPMISAKQQLQAQSDNTKANKTNSKSGGATADQQKENAADRELARKIRQAIIQDKGLSTYAHNVKVIVRDGQVILKGPVESEVEKSSIAAKAAEIAGADKVENELTIKS